MKDTISTQINNFEDFKKYLQEESSVLENIKSAINDLGQLDIRLTIAKLLKTEEERASIVAPTEILRRFQNFWQNETGQIDRNSAKDKIRKRNIYYTLDQAFKFLAQSKEIKISEIRGLELRIYNFKEYLRSHSGEAKLPFLMQQFFQYFNLLQKEKSDTKIIECLNEFPPSSDYLKCLDGTSSRMQEQIRKLAFPKQDQQFLNAYILAIQKAAENLKASVSEGDPVHIPPFLEYCFAFKPANLIKDQSYTTPRSNILPDQLWQIFGQFNSDLKSFWIEECKNYNGAIALFAEYQDIATLCSDMEDLDDDKTGIELEKKQQAVKKFEILNERLRDLGFEGGVQGLISGFDDDMTWNWKVIAERLTVLQQKDFDEFKKIIDTSNPIIANVDRDVEMSDASSDAYVSGANKDAAKSLLKTKAKNFAKDLLSDNLEKQLQSLEGLWLLSYLENHNNSYALFMEAIYELGKRYYNRQVNDDSRDLDKDDHFKNAKIFLRSIRDKIPEEQRFRIDNIAGRENDAARIDLEKFKLYACAVACQHNNESLMKKNGYSFTDFSFVTKQNIVSLLNIALSAGFENLAHELYTNESLRKNSPTGFELKIDAKFVNGHNVLTRAIKNGHKALVNKLISLGANKNSKNSKSNRTAISYVAEKGDLEMLKLFKGADINLADSDGLTPLIFAAQNGNIEVFKELIKLGAKLNPNGPQVKFSDQIDGDKKEEIETIIKYIILFETCEFAVVEEFKEDLYKMKPDLLDIFFNQEKSIVTNTIYILISGNKIKIFQELINFMSHKKIDLDQVDNFLEKPIISDAVEKGRIDFVRVLLEKGAKVNYDLDKMKKTPLIYAIASKNIEMIILLMENGADISKVLRGVGDNIMLVSGLTEDENIKKLITATDRLFRAVNEDNLDAVKKAIEDGALITAKDEDGATPYSMATNNGKDQDGEVAKFLAQELEKKNLSENNKKRTRDALGCESPERPAKRQECMTTPPSTSVTRNIAPPLLRRQQGMRR